MNRTDANLEFWRNRLDTFALVSLGLYGAFSGKTDNGAVLVSHPGVERVSAHRARVTPAKRGKGSPLKGIDALQDPNPAERHAAMSL